ncbi:MAG TPA: histidine--tRNA ligase [Gammaproteobacteria bacterium]|nr:histidine--tRNA ligase [Gammaproteobacteria bacterium]
MTQSIQAVRGMPDILPDETPCWQYLETEIKRVLSAYGYQEIRFPLLEKTALFKRSIGEVTDIVEKEMYTFEDRNGDSLTLRPEGTAVCVRAGIERGLLYNQTQRLWYMGPMFRHERPQKGRYRQFHQVGVETFGISGPDIDAELILISRRLWQRLGLLKHLRLEINTLGTPESRAAYREKLIEYLLAHEHELDAESRSRLHSNPLRILDSKNPNTRQIVKGAPDMMAFMDAASKAHFQLLCEFLDDNGVDYIVNPRLVRGLDYYSKTVFEWITDQLGAQGTVCAGGRFDGLVDYLGGKSTPAVGFAMGLERLVSMITDLDILKTKPRVDCYLVLAGEAAQRKGLQLAERVHNALPHINLLSHCGGGSFKSQMKKADRSGASIALIIGDDELAQQSINVKYLRENKPQSTCAETALTEFLAAEFPSG